MIDTKMIPEYMKMKYTSVYADNGTWAAEEAQGPPNQSHISPSVLEYEEHGILVYEEVY